MDNETAKALNNLSKKINAIQLQLDRYFGIRCDENLENIKMDENGLLEVAETVSLHDDAITELAQLVSDLKEGE